MTQQTLSSQDGLAGVSPLPSQTDERKASNDRAQATSNGLIKLAIVFIVFPTISTIIRFFFALLLGLPLMLLPEAQQAAATMPMVVVATAVGLVGSFMICRQFWPKSESPTSSTA